MPRRPTRPSLGSLSFRARFALVSGLLLLLVGVVLARLLGSMIEHRALTAAEQVGVTAVDLALTPVLSPGDVETVMGPDLQRRFDAMLAEVAPKAASSGHGLLRLKIFNSAGTVVYSDLDELMGRSFASEELTRALRGETVSVPTTMTSLDEQEDAAVHSALEVYVPLRLDGDEPVGVAEVYLPYEPVRRDIAADTRALYLTLLGALLVFYLLMFRMVSQASRRLHETSRRNEYLAHHDPLTDLPNRTLLMDRLERALAAAHRGNRHVALLLIDLDRFKEVNDTLGHDTGDRLLQQVALRLGDQLREMDTVARLGGDEFVVLLPELDNVSAQLVAERLLAALHLPFEVEGIDLAVEASIGIASYPEHGDDEGTLMQHADVAMYVAKRSRGTYAVYDSQSDVSSLASMTLLNDLRRALDEGELTLYYQPKEELADGVVRSVEALVRWQHPTRGLVGPCDFVPVAEQTGLIIPLTTFVLRTALEQVSQWQEDGRDLTVAVNLSARNLSDERLPDLIASLLERTGVHPSRLEVEVTETSTMSDEARAVGVLLRLADLGVAVTVDDYGTGYSSLSYLRSLPVGTLKIDRSFVTGFLDDDDNAVIVRSTIELAHSLGLRVVAEGVEDWQTHDALAELGCHVAQGYYLSRPVPPEGLVAVLDDVARRGPRPAHGGGLATAAAH